MMEIKGHPTVDAHRTRAPALRISLCAGCGGLKTILFLSKDRWFCTTCRSHEEAKPTQIFVSNPSRRR